eukprot:m.437221 g.437221  ORF g.437221 m.437221 type:complete len:122 (-) comp21434_c0_seq6:521-886(-)
MGPARLNIWAPFSAGFDIEFADGSSDANSEESQVVVQGMEGPVCVQTQAGNVRLRKIKGGSAHVVTESGNISADSIVGNVHIASASGNIKYDPGGPGGQHSRVVVKTFASTCSSLLLRGVA